MRKLIKGILHRAISVEGVFRILVRFLFFFKDTYYKIQLPLCGVGADVENHNFLLHRKSVVVYLCGFFSCITEYVYKSPLKRCHKKQASYHFGCSGLLEFSCLTGNGWIAEARVHALCLTTVVLPPDDMCLKISKSKAFVLVWITLNV